MFFRKRKVIYVEKKSSGSKILNIASIISITLATIKAVYYGFINIKIAALILVGSIILIALGNSISKLILVVIGAYVFFKITSNGDENFFQIAITNFKGLLIVLFGIFVILGGMNKKK